MSVKQAAFAATMALALSAGAADAASRLFGDSVLNSGDGVRDEITGTGPDLVFVAGSQSADDLRSTVKDLRKDHRVHLIHADDDAALKAYLDRRHLTGVPMEQAATALAQR